MKCGECGRIGIAGIKKAGRIIKRSVRSIMVCATAVFLALLLSVLSAWTVVSDAASAEKAGLHDGDIAVAWKPAYLFSIPTESDTVLYDAEQGGSAGEELRAAVYDESSVDLQAVRGKVIFVIPGSFIPG